MSKVRKDKDVLEWKRAVRSDTRISHRMIWWSKVGNYEVQECTSKYEKDDDGKPIKQIKMDPIVLDRTDEEIGGMYKMIPVPQRTLAPSSSKSVARTWALTCPFLFSTAS